MYRFINTEYEEAIEARYFCTNGFGIAIVAAITKGVDWAAYIAADQSMTEEGTLRSVLEYGCKLSEKDARYFFPEIKLPYRP